MKTVYRIATITQATWLISRVTGHPYLRLGLQLDRKWLYHHKYRTTVFKSVSSFLLPGLRILTNTDEIPELRGKKLFVGLNSFVGGYWVRIQCVPSEVLQKLLDKKGGD